MMNSTVAFLSLILFNSTILDEKQPSGNCNQTGQFQDESDTTCARYYACYKKESSFIQINLQCPVGTRFNPEIGECSVDFKCGRLITNNVNEHADLLKWLIDLLAVGKKESSSLETNKMSTRLLKSENLCLVDGGENFVCEMKGRFRKTDDLTCSKYYLCAQLKDGGFIQYEYSCPEGSLFDPNVGKCSQLYQCPCVSTSSPSTELDTPTTSEIATSTTFQGTTCRVDEDPYFVCPDKGRFKKPNDLTCTKYFLCVQLRNGSLLHTEYSCPLGSYFKEEISKCTELYQCPCSVAKTTSQISAETTTFVKETTINPCRIDEDPNFICTKKGRFKKPNDLSCSKYYLCTQLKNGSYLQSEYSCPDGTYFDQNINKCNEVYQCPCLIPTTATEIATVTTTPKETTINPCRIDEDPNFICTEKGRFKKPNDLSCSKYYLCTQLKNGSYLQSEYYCPDGTYFDQNINKCNEVYQCPCLIPTTATKIPTETTTPKETTINPCRIDEDPNFICTEKGRFKKPNDLSCSKYYLCTQLKNGSYLQSEYSCPDGTYFDQNINKCNEVYQCPCLIPTTATEIATVTTTPKETTINPCRIDEDPNFICAEKGRFKKPNDLSCSKYYLCTQLKNGSYLQSEYSCPDGTYFDQNINKCNEVYQCPCLNPTNSTEIVTVTTTLKETTVNPCRIDEDPNFICTEKGRFKKPNDLTCTGYFLCTQLKNGSFIQTEYLCPTGSYFNQEINKCTEQYQCPCSSITQSTA